MKKGLSLIALTSFLFLGSHVSFAQSGLKKANNEYEQWAYAESIKIFERIDEKGYSSNEVLEKLGNSYYFNADYARAYKHYNRLFTEYDTIDFSSDLLFRYAQTLKHVELESQAKNYFDLFVDKVGKETQIAKLRLNEAALKKQIQENSGRYENVEGSSINTPFSDYGSFVYNNTLYFTSNKEKRGFSKKIHTWTGAPFTNLYSLSLNDESNHKIKPKLLKGDVKSILNESSAIITADGKTMYFTRNNINNNKQGYDENRFTKLKIYKADLIENRWQNIRELPFNSNEFNTAHPALSPDEKTLYFASDRPGGYGASDIWKVNVSGEVYSTPQNLGPEINTEGRETFPFVNSNNELYFSSDGRIGMGGLDVYGVKIIDENTFGEIHNLGEPINSTSDDFAYYIDFSSKKGFFSSNREGGLGKDDIYSFVETRMLPLECIQNLEVVVVDSRTRNIIPDARITLYDKMYNEKGWTNSYQNNAYTFETKYDCGEMYRLKVEKDDFITSEEIVTIDTKSGVTKKTIVLERIKVEVKKNDDLFKILKLKPIYFDYNKHDIRPDAALELAKVVEVLLDYPRMKIDVRSHTDSRGSDDYNLKLSQLRAQSTAEWIINQGIDASRISYKGYGESQLINHCKNGIKCSDEVHEENRRSEFIVLEL